MIRPMTAADVPSVAALEKLCFSDPWSVSSIASELDNPLSLWLVWEEDGRVLGYCYAGRAIERPANARKAENTSNLAHEAQHRGIGRQLYARIEELLRRQGCRKVFAIVTSANELSLAFHRAIGYRDAACFRQVGYKFGRWYDVTWLEKSLCPLGEPSEFPISWKEVL